MITAITLLREAHRLIDTGEQYCICFAIDHADVYSDLPDARRVSTELLDYIENQVKGFGWLGDWLNAQLGYLPETDVRTLARLAWIDRMVHELETKGRLP